MIDLASRYPVVLDTMPRALVDQLSGDATLIRARAGRTLIGLRAVSTSVYLVCDGRAQVSLFSLGGREVILRSLAAGALFGELAAIDEQPRSASITATTDCTLATIPGEVFRNAVISTPEAALWMGRRLVNHIRELTGRVFELNALRVATRVHCELLRLATPDADDENTAVIDPSPTHAELAARVGTHREAVTRELGFLVECGVIAQQRRRLSILDLPALSQMVREAAGAVDGD